MRCSSGNYCKCFNQNCRISTKNFYFLINDPTYYWFYFSYLLFAVRNLGIKLELRDNRIILTSWRFKIFIAIFFNINWTDITQPVFTCSKPAMEAVGGQYMQRQVYLLLTLSKFHTKFWCFHCWLCTSKCWLWKDFMMPIHKEGYFDQKKYCVFCILHVMF